MLAGMMTGGAAVKMTSEGEAPPPGLFEVQVVGQSVMIDASPS